MNNTRRQRVIVHTEPKLVGAALGAWLAARPDLDVVVDPGGAIVSTAGALDVIVVSIPMESDAMVLVLDHSSFSVLHGDTVVAQGYRGLEQIYSVIKERRGPPLRASARAARPKGGGSTETP